MTVDARTTSPRAASVDADASRAGDACRCSPDQICEREDVARAPRGFEVGTRVLAAALCIGSIAVVSRGALAMRDDRTAARIALVAHRIDLSTAPAEELALLPEVGGRLAARIAADRATNGAFGSVDELARVGGFGAAKIEALRDSARAGGR